MNTAIVLSAKYLFLICLFIGGLVFLLLRRQDKVSFIKLGLVSGLLSFGFLELAGHLVYDPRPFVVLHVLPLIPHPADNGFPSDHVLLTMWLALLVFVYDRKVGFALVIVSLAVGSARVLALIHHPVDVLGSIVIALAAWGIARFLLQYFKI